jgi:hypothetical protein
MHILDRKDRVREFWRLYRRVARYHHCGRAPKCCVADVALHLVAQWNNVDFVSLLVLQRVQLICLCRRGYCTCVYLVSGHVPKILHNEALLCLMLARRAYFKLMLFEEDDSPREEVENDEESPRDEVEDDEESPREEVEDDEESPREEVEDDEDDSPREEVEDDEDDSPREEVEDDEDEERDCGSRLLFDPTLTNPKPPTDAASAASNKAIRSFRCIFFPSFVTRSKR